MKVIKKDGSEVIFDIEEVRAFIEKVNEKVFDSQRLPEAALSLLLDQVYNACLELQRPVNTDEIQKFIENILIKIGYPEFALEVSRYHFQKLFSSKKNTTDDRVREIVTCNSEEVLIENANKNPRINSVQRDYLAGELSKDYSERLLLPKEITEAHKEGIIHFHDLDYFIQPMHNCELINLEDMLQNGTVISGTLIEKPKSFSTACNIATQIIAQVASNQYGGQSISLTHLAPFVQVSREKISEQLKDELKIAEATLEQAKFDEIVETRVRREVAKGVQTIQYQVVTLMTTNGQAPFVTVFMYLGEAASEREKKDLALIIEEVLKQRLLGIKNKVGVYVTPAFPKLIYVLEEDNIEEGTPYFYLTELAAKCSAKRLVPDYISEKKMKEVKEGYCFPIMGCRSILSVWRDSEGKAKFYGRFNQGVVTLNLVDVALSAESDIKKFWDVLEDRLELCHRALQFRHNRLKGALSDVAPILWQDGALARLKKGEKIDKLLYGGYSTISLGYAGLCECVRALTGKSHTDPECTPLALDIMKKLNEKCTEWKKAENIGYAIYGTPLESTTYRFAKTLQKRFGVIPGVTDKSYITNSYHVHVTEEIDAFSKLHFEAQFQDLSTGGAISYVEVPDLQNNIPAVLSLIRYIYDNIMYAELNTKSDYCQKCGFDGEIQIVEEEGKLIWKCPNCGNTDPESMNVVRRTCGYLGSQYWNQGRTQEIKDRVLHI